MRLIHIAKYIDEAAEESETIAVFSPNDYDNDTRAYTVDENITEQAIFDRYIQSDNAARDLTENDFTVYEWHVAYGSSISEKFDVVYNDDVDEFQLVTLEGAEFDYEEQSAYKVVALAYDGTSSWWAPGVTVYINDIDETDEDLSGTALDII